MLTYTDSEVRKFHPLCKAALNDALVRLGQDAVYEVKHHLYTGSLEMDFAIRNKTTLKYLCVVEVKRTPSDVQSTRYQFQAQSYVQMNTPLNEKPFYIITNLEKLISFRYDTAKPSVYQQMLEPGLESICDFSVDNEAAIQSKLATAFQRILDDFINNRYTEMTTLDDFLVCMSTASTNRQQWKSRMAVLMYEYMRGVFHAVRKPTPTITYNVSHFAGDVEQICNEANRVDFDAIFSYNTTDFLPRLTLSSHLLTEMYNYGHSNISGDAIADALHEKISENHHHEGEVATDPELARLVSTFAGMFHGEVDIYEKVCDPAAGSGNLICSAIDAFSLQPDQVVANDINKKLIELLSARLGLCYPSSIDHTCAPQITSSDIVNLNAADFNGVKIVLLNPPFVAGINCAARKVPFFNKIHSITGADAITKVGQQNLGAVFLETVCALIHPDTTIACIFPKAQLMERGTEAVAFRRMLLGIFGLEAIISYPGTGLFESVTEETCILIGKKGSTSNEIKLYSSDVNVADIDLHSLSSFTGTYNTTSFDNITSDIVARLLSRTELFTSIDDGWRIINSEMLESIAFVEANIVHNSKLSLLPDTANSFRKGQVGVNGGSDLTFFDSIDSLYSSYSTSVTLDEGMRNAKSNDFILTSGDSKFLNFNALTAALANRIIGDYVTVARPAGNQQRSTKTVAEWLKIAKKDGSVHFPANSVLLPTKTRRSGRVHVSTIPMFVSTNFVVFSYLSLDDAKIVASYLATIFYQLECEVASKDHAGVRKSEVRDAVTTHAPIVSMLSLAEKAEILSEIPNIVFQDLNNPTIQHIDEIWANILYGSTSGSTKLNEANRLLRFLANRRNPV